MVKTARSSMRLMQILRVLILAILILGTIANPMDRSQAAPNNTLTVCSTGCDYTSIQLAVLAASAGDTIQLLSSDPHTEDDIEVMKNVTIKGLGDDPSTIVQAASTQAAATKRVFNIATGTTVTIQNLTIRYGNSLKGAGIYNEGNLTLNNVIVEWNQNQGIYNSGVLIANDSVIRYNVTDGYGGGLYNELGSITSLENTSVSSNKADPLGGGIYNLGKLYIENSQININRCEENIGADSKGGGIYNKGNLEVLDSAIQGNQVLGDTSSDAWGGGIYSQDGTAQIINSVIELNHGAEVDNSLRGGGLYFLSGEVEITDSTISGNYQVKIGGGIYIGGGLVDINNSTIDGNTADETGGGIAIYGLSSQVNIINSTISNNTANQNGGGIFIEDGSIHLTNSTISGNSSNKNGGGLYIQDGSGQLTNSTISSNFAKDYGGGLFLELVGDAPVYLNNVTITRNRARTDNLSGDGGGLYYSYVSTRRVYLKNSILANNYLGFVLPTVYDDCYGTVYSQDYNLIGLEDGCSIDGDSANNLTGDPMLDVFGDYGGSTQTYMPLANSPVIDTANPGGCTDSAEVILSTDQRGYARTVDGDAVGGAVCDIGAVEFALNPIPTLSSLDPDSIQVGSADFALIVSGSNYVDVAVVQWNGSDLPTTFVSSNQLIAQISAALVAAEDSATVTVVNPAPGGGVSNALVFRIIYKSYLPFVTR